MHASASSVSPVHPHNPVRWFLQFHPTVASTNATASLLPAWSAVRAAVQTGGRGRHGRKWISDPGGLWLSAVVPCPEPRTRWGILPLAAGWALLAMLRDCGVVNPRLRWPNDVLVGQRKLAGLLVERFSPDTAVIGVGLNVYNLPEEVAPDLAGQTVRLADLVDSSPTLEELAGRVLEALMAVHARVAAGGFREIVEQLNQAWALPRRVSLQMRGGARPVLGYFTGIDEQGRVRLVADEFGPCAYDASHVVHFGELE